MITRELKEYIRQRDVKKVRNELLAIFNAKPDLGDGQFDENLNYAEKELGIDKFFEPYSGEFQMKNSKEEWTTNYVAKIFIQLRKEFSKELIVHLKEVAPIVYNNTNKPGGTGGGGLDSPMQPTPGTTEKNFRVVCVTVVKWVLAIVVVGCLIAVGINLF